MEPPVNRFHKDYIPAWKLTEARDFLYKHSLLTWEQINAMPADRLMAEVDLRLGLDRRRRREPWTSLVS